MGAKVTPTLRVPNVWKAKSTRRMTTERGTTSLLTAGAATAIPSTAETTDTAGVRSPSEMVRLGEIHQRETMEREHCDSPGTEDDP